MTGSSIDTLIGEVRNRRILVAQAKEVREKAGITAARMAKAVGVSTGTLIKWENGEIVPRAGVTFGRWEEAVSRLREFIEVGDIEPPTPASAVADVLSMRVCNALVREFGRDNIKTLSDLAKISAARLLDIRNFGHGSLREVERVLEHVGLELAPETAERLQRELDARGPGI